MRVVLDAGPIIHLSWIDHLDLVDALFEEVLIPSAVRDEVIASPAGTLGLDRICSKLGEGKWTVREVFAPAEMPPPSRSSLGRGETEAIYLAEETRADLLVTDDTEAKRVAATRGIEVTGTLGVLKTAREKGLIASVLPLVVELRRLGQWISEGLMQTIRTEESGPSQ